MTLLVAQRTSNSSAWMTADAAITGGPLSLREREYRQKVFPVLSGTALVGYAGPIIGESDALDLDQTPNHVAAIERLVTATNRTPNLAFAFAWLDGETVQLVRVENGVATHQDAMLLGDSATFSAFQEARLGRAPSHPPSAVLTLAVATRDPTNPIPDEIISAVQAMWSIFPTADQNNIGGWVTPFILTENGSSPISYVYSSSDPIIEHLLPGDILVQGTAEAGGFGFCLTELHDQTGIVVYWQQRPGGTIIQRVGHGIKYTSINGLPSTFRAVAEGVTGCPVYLWFEDPSTGPTAVVVNSTRDILDAEGNVRFRQINHGNNSFSLQWVRRGPGSFHAQSEPHPENSAIGAAKGLLSRGGTPTMSTDTGEKYRYRIQFNCPINQQTVHGLGRILSDIQTSGDFKDVTIVSGCESSRHDDSFNLYGLFKTISIPIHVHFSGIVTGLALPAFLGCARRTCAAETRFNLAPFRWYFNGGLTTADLQHAVKSLSNDRKLAVTIFERHTTLNRDTIDELYIERTHSYTADEAMELGFVSEIIELDAAHDDGYDIKAFSIEWKP